ncbi:O-antigen translocase [uncultured Flavobacterium sp.]|uniref:O-antigen translocase n=1 Tax=uncultured Flavobacterium sp. TaxID=165435 RepID=UPI00292F0AFE|nr:O-antigen translocase [uncultured Flavobacterium sp.]
MKLIKTSFFSAVITLIRISSGFVAGKVVALFTGPAGVAIIGQFNNFITIVLTFANGAINSGVIKYTAEFEGDEIQLKKLFSTSFKISVYCSVFFGFFLLTVASFISKLLFQSALYINPIRVLGLTIILYSLNSLLIAILNGLGQIKKYTLVNAVGSVLGLLFTVILVFYFKIEGALYALVLTQSLVFFVTLVLIVKGGWFSLSFFRQPFDKGIAIKLSRYSLMAVISSLCMPLAQIVLRNMVIEKLGVDAAGYWQGMMRISDGYLMLVTISLSTYYLPKLSSLSSNQELRTEIFQGYKIILPAVLFSCSIIYFLRYFIIGLLFTKEFESMGDLFFFQLLGDFFKIAAWLLAYLMTAKAMTKTFIITEIVFTLTYVLISYNCVDYYKLNGITIAFALNYFIYFLVILFVFRKLLFNVKDNVIEG